MRLITIKSGKKLIIESNKIPDNFTGKVECASGDKFWYRNGKYHREDGPAIECWNGGKYYYLNGKECTESEFLKKTKQIKQTDPSSKIIVEIDGKKYRLVPV